MKVLLLGGTSDGKRLARELHDKGVTVVYSIAGLVRQPDLPCEVISGGFSKRGGLLRYIQDNQITEILDATHPFAITMSATAQAVAKQAGIPITCYERPAWQPQVDDQWTFFKDWSELLRALAPYQSVLLTQGQLSESMLAALKMHRKRGQHFVHRTAIEPKHRIPDWMTWVQDIGPFSLESEHSLLRQHKIEVIVSKHSGGKLPAKMLAARVNQLPVLLLERPL